MILTVLYAPNLLNQFKWNFLTRDDDSEVCIPAAVSCHVSKQTTPNKYYARQNLRNGTSPNNKIINHKDHKVEKKSANRKSLKNLLKVTKQAKRWLVAKYYNIDTLGNVNINKATHFNNVLLSQPNTNTTLACNSCFLQKTIGIEMDPGCYTPGTFFVGQLET